MSAVRKNDTSLLWPGFWQWIRSEVVQRTRGSGMTWRNALGKVPVHPWALPFLVSGTANRAGCAWIRMEWKPSNGHGSHDIGSGAYRNKNLPQFMSQVKPFSWSLIYNQCPQHWLLLPRRMIQIQSNIFSTSLSDPHCKTKSWIFLFTAGSQERGC